MINNDRFLAISYGSKQVSSQVSSDHSLVVSSGQQQPPGTTDKKSSEAAIPVIKSNSECGITPSSGTFLGDIFLQICKYLVEIFSMNKAEKPLLADKQNQKKWRDLPATMDERVENLNTRVGTPTDNLEALNLKFKLLGEEMEKISNRIETSKKTIENLKKEIAKGEEFVLDVRYKFNDRNEIQISTEDTKNAAQLEASFPLLKKQLQEEEANYRDLDGVYFTSFINYGNLQQRIALLEQKNSNANNS